MKLGKCRVRAIARRAEGGARSFAEILLQIGTSHRPARIWRQVDPDVVRSVSEGSTRCGSRRWFREGENMAEPNDYGLLFQAQGSFSASSFRSASGTFARLLRVAETVGATIDVSVGV